MNLAIPDLLVLFIAGAGFLSSAGLGIQLLSRADGLRTTNILLGLLLILLALSTLNGLMSLIGLYSTYQQLYFLPLVFSLSIGPLFYFFVRSKTDPGFQIKKEHWPHTILPLAQFGFYSVIGFRSAEFKSAVWRELISPYVQYIEEVLFIFSSLTYILFALNHLKRFPKMHWKIPVYRWLKRLAFALLFLLVIHSTYEIADWIVFGLLEYNIFNNDWLSLPLKLADAILPLLIAYNALKYQHLVFPAVQKSRTAKGDMEVMMQIQKLFKEDELYLDPEVNLNTLASTLSLPRNTISRELSNQNTSFRKLLNGYRVEHFKRLSTSDKIEQLSLLGLAYESGFNSKASFNRAFKEKTGQTPTEYLELRKVQ